MLHTFLNIILFLFIIFLIILGITELIKQITQKLYTEKKNILTLLVFPIPDPSENIEYTLRSIVAKARWSGVFTPHKIICIDYGLSESERKTCEIICKEHEFIELMYKDEFYDYLEKINQR